MTGHMDWSGYDEQDFAQYYWDEVAPEMEADGLDPSEPPTAAWMREHGFSGFNQAIPRVTGMTPMNFFNDVLKIRRGSGRIYDLDIKDPQTRELAYRFAVKHKMNRKNLDKRYAKKHLWALDRVCEAMRSTHNHDDLIKLGSEDTPKSKSYQEFLDAFDALNEVYGDSSMVSIYKMTNYFYQYLLRRPNPVDDNPVEDLVLEYDWDLSTGDPPAMNTDQVWAIAKVANTTKERTLVVCLCAAGIRRREVGEIHKSQVVFDPPKIDTPVIEFEVRKNGPGTVNLVYGAEILRKRIDELERKHGNDWNGYLFPSPNRDKEHISETTVNNWMADLVERAEAETDVEMTLEDGGVPTPQTARRFWYNTHSEGIQVLVDAMQVIANEQGSTDPMVVIRNYLSKQRRLEILRDHMAKELASAFEGTEIDAVYQPEAAQADPPLH